MNAGVLGPTGQPFSGGNSSGVKTTENGLFVRLSRNSLLDLPKSFWPVGMMPLPNGTAFTGCFFVWAGVYDDSTLGEVFELPKFKVKLGFIREIHLISVPHLILPVQKDLVPNWLQPALEFVSRRGGVR